MLQTGSHWASSSQAVAETAEGQHPLQLSCGCSSALTAALRMPEQGPNFQAGTNPESHGRLGHALILPSAAATAAAAQLGLPPSSVPGMQPPPLIIPQVHRISMGAPPGSPVSAHWGHSSSPVVHGTRTRRALSVPPGSRGPTHAVAASAAGTPSGMQPQTPIPLLLPHTSSPPIVLATSPGAGTSPTVSPESIRLSSSQRLSSDGRAQGLHDTGADCALAPSVGISESSAAMAREQAQYMQHFMRRSSTGSRSSSGAGANINTAGSGGSGGINSILNSQQLPGTGVPLSGNPGALQAQQYPPTPALHHYPSHIYHTTLPVGLAMEPGAMPPPPSPRRSLGLSRGSPRGPLSGPAAVPVVPPLIPGPPLVPAAVPAGPPSPGPDLYVPGAPGGSGGG
jgi:hypothetical protein